MDAEHYERDFHMIFHFKTDQHLVSERNEWYFFLHNFPL